MEKTNKKELKILILEDNPIDAKLNTIQLKKENILFESKLVETENEFVSGLKNYKPDLILSDYSLPDFNGMQALKISKILVPDIPFIMVTGALNDETAANCIKEGAWDYVIKEHLGYLGTAVNNALERKEEIEKKVIAEAELNRLATAIEQSEEMVLITGLDGNIQYVNPAFEKITGYSRKEAINKNPNILKSGKQDDNYYKNLWDTILDGNVWRGQMVNKKKNGNLFIEETRISPVRNKAGKIINFVALKHDVTQQKELEQQLEESKRLETIGTLAGGIAHDFNNILATILGYIEIALINEEQKDKAFEYLYKIEKASLRAKDIVEQILIFSRQNRTMKQKKIKLQNVINDTIEQISDSAPSNINIISDIDQNCGQVMADESQIYQVITNLCNNGIQAMSKKGTDLYISLSENKCDKKIKSIYPDFKAEHYALIKISDSGSGMSKEVQERIFEPFFTTKPVGEGTGLGLSVVHGIIKNHKGKIKVESIHGTGTIFYILLPIIKI